MSTVQKPKELGRQTTSRFTIMLAALVLTVTYARAATLELGAASSTNDYHSNLTTGGSISCTIDNCVRVNIIDRHNGGGGIFILHGAGGWSGGLPTLADNSSVVYLSPDITELRFAVSVDYNDWFTDALTDDQKREFAVSAFVTVTPTHTIPGNPEAKQVETFTFGAGQDGSHTIAFLPNWVDSTVRVSLVMAPDPAHLLNSPLAEWRFETPPLRVRFLPDLLLRLSVLPLGIIGKPPGLESWSRITQTEGSVVKTGIHEETASADTHSTSVGIGPIPLDSSDEVTRERRTGEGTAQLLGWEQKGSLDSTGPYRNGEGDVLVLAQGIDALVYHSALDADFLLHKIDGVAWFPMRELVIQRDYLTGRATVPSSNTIVRGLAFGEIQALIGLNPLLQSPYAPLGPPRFHKVGVSFNWQGGRLQQSFSVEGADIQSALQATSMTTIGDTSFSLELPINTIIKAVSGYDVPAALVNPKFSDVQIGTSIVQLVKSAELTRHTGTVVEYQLHDSTGAQHCTEAYFDSLFNGLMFRDCTPLCERPGALCLSDLLRHTEQWWFERVEAAKGGGLGRRYDSFLVGSLRGGGPDDRRDLRFERVDRPGPFYQSSVDRTTGGFALPNLAPGIYRAEFGTELLELELSEKGDIRYQRRGKDARSGFEYAYTAADGSYAVRSFRDACTAEERTRKCMPAGSDCTSTHHLKDLCGERGVLEETCTVVGNRMRCR
jgi:hypothetical protein